MVALEGRDVAQRPHGTTDRVFGFLMERISAPNYRWVLAQLTGMRPQSYLEIGFGAGELAQLVARKLQPARLVGVDPSELMVRSARRKLEPFADFTRIELLHGDDTLIASLGGPFDAIVATHSFQFWRNPMATLARIHALIGPDGLLILVLRKHKASKVPKWVPNPITRNGHELTGARQALADAGFLIIADKKLRTGSTGLIAIKN
jgi:ubiquinone/menaquinone biosynthesis C-methylase UbiE